MKKSCSKCKLKDSNKDYFAGYRELKDLYGTTKKTCVTVVFIMICVTI